MGNWKKDKILSAKNISLIWQIWYDNFDMITDALILLQRSIISSGELSGGEGNMEKENYVILIHLYVLLYCGKLQACFLYNG